MHISIKTLKGKTINLEVEDSSNTIDVKIHGEPMSELVLRLGPSVPDEAALIRIFLATLKGGKRILQVKRSDTIKDVKAKLEEIEGIPVKQLILLFAGRILEDSQTVAESHIEHESTLHMVLRLCGC